MDIDDISRKILECNRDIEFSNWNSELLQNFSLQKYYIIKILYNNIK